MVKLILKVKNLNFFREFNSDNIVKCKQIANFTSFYKVAKYVEKGDFINFFEFRWICISVPGDKKNSTVDAKNIQKSTWLKNEKSCK